jgi:hypothetical protein
VSPNGDKRTATPYSLSDALVLGCINVLLLQSTLHALALLAWINFVRVATMENVREHSKEEENRELK